MICPDRISHIIRPGDTLYRLARVYDTTIHSLRSLNPGLSPPNLKIGQSIVVCPGPRYNPAPPPTPTPRPTIPATPTPVPLPSPVPPIPAPMPSPKPPVVPPMLSQKPPPPEPAPPPPPPLPEPCIEPPARCMGDSLSLDAHDLCQDMRTACQHMAQCAVLFGLSAAEGLCDAEVAAERLMCSWVDLGDIFTHYHGTEVGRALEGLLSEQAALCRDVQALMVTEGPDAARPTDDRWRCQGAYLAQYFSAINPHYEEPVLLGLVEDWQDLTRRCLCCRLDGDMAGYGEGFDLAMAQSRRTADYLSRGILARCPNAF